MAALKDILNEKCRESRICPEPRMLHAAELWRDGSKTRIIVGCFDDGLVVSCLTELEGKQQCCFTSEGAEPLFHNWCGLLTSKEVGYHIKEIEVEKD